jgi:putative transposase
MIVQLICHIQWSLSESAKALVHGFSQALMRRGLPRSLLTDNGGAMMSEEFKNGLHTLGILHQTTLPFSPFQLRAKVSMTTVPVTTGRV